MTETHKPIFEDCAFPDDCQCAVRGYEWERDECAVPAVRAAAKAFGIGRGIFGKPRTPFMTPEANNFGNVMPIGNTGDLAADVLSALQQLDSDVPYMKDQIELLLRKEGIVHSLQAEAGVASIGGITIFHTRVETLANGKHLGAWLMSMPHEKSGCVCWLVGIMTGYHNTPSISCASKTMLDATLEQLRLAAGGGGSIRSHWSDVPTEQEIRDLQDYD